MKMIALIAWPPVSKIIRAARLQNEIAPDNFKFDTKNSLKNAKKDPKNEPKNV